MYIIRAGLVRMYLSRPDGREFNKAFQREGGLTGSHAAAVTDRPSITSIQAMEPTEVLAIPFRALERRAAEDIQLAHLLRRLAEERFWRREQREAQLLMETATERFMRLVREEAWLLGRVPQKHLASYLGITEVSLSRLRARLRAQETG